MRLTRIYKDCLVCKITFRIKPYEQGTRKYCSKECYTQTQKGKAPWNKTFSIRDCLSCNKKFNVAPWQIRGGRTKHCSMKCRRTAVDRYCLYCGAKIKGTFSPSKIAAGQGKYCSKTHANLAMKGIIRSPKTIYKPGDIRISGINGRSWKGGVTSINDKIRKSLEYKIWRKAVFERDNYLCIWGGKEHGNNLHADHIKPFAFYPELRFVIDNGRTLCKSCHIKTPTYLKNVL